MGWFGRNKPSIDVQEHSAKDTAIEIVAHKNARKEVVEEAKEANKKLNKLLVENGFTLKIYLAAGGSHPQTKKGSI